MFRKATLILICLFLLNAGKVFSQKDHEAYINGYRYSDYLYFDSIHKVGCNDLSELNNSYEFYIVFKIDTNANVIDYELEEIPVIKIPDKVKSYTLQLVMSTNQKWTPQVKNSIKVVSDEMVYRVTLSKRNQDKEQRMKDKEKLIEYFFGRGINTNERLMKFALADHKRYINLSY